MKTLISIVLASLLAIQTVDSAPPPPKPKLAVIECGIALVVIVVGIIVWVKLYHLCKKVLPPLPPDDSTNAPSTNSAVMFNLGDDNATDLDAAGSASFTVTVSSNGPSIGSPAVPLQTVSQSNYVAQLQSEYGLDVSNPTNTIPGVSWDGTTLTVTNGAPTHMIVVEKMQGTNWIALMTNCVSEGIQLQVEDQDASVGQGFYRVEVK